MIFVTVGTQLPFDRMIRMVDEWVVRSDVDVFAQIGPGCYKPKNFPFVEYLDSSSFEKYVNRANCIIAHAGMGSIITSLKYAKPIILVPRMASLGEHRNGHQEATARKFNGRPLIRVANDLDEVDEAYASINSHFDSGSCDGISPYADPSFISRLNALIFDI